MQSGDFLKLDSKDLEKYVGSDKIALLNNISSLAKVANLSSKYLYKEFTGSYIIGNLSLLKAPKVTIIGTREK